MGQIGKLKISRLICGGNLINGYAHARDMIYISELLKHYFTDGKIIQTWELCEQCGINTMISTIDDPYAIDAGAHGAFIQGEMGDRLTQQGRLDLVAKVIEHAQKNGLIAGVACHSIEVPIACEKAALPVDFYMKTLHSPNYWSATPDEKKGPFDLPRHDNMWCLEPDKTIEFMKTCAKPWIAYKVLAAGAIQPSDGFQYAFENDADFACVGMCEFQVREDAIIANKVLTNLTRPRPWRG